MADEGKNGYDPQTTLELATVEDLCKMLATRCSALVVIMQREVPGSINDGKYSLIPWFAKVTPAGALGLLEYSRMTIAFQVQHNFIAQARRAAEEGDSDNA